MPALYGDITRYNQWDSKDKPLTIYADDGMLTVKSATTSTAFYGSLSLSVPEGETVPVTGAQPIRNLDGYDPQTGVFKALNACLVQISVQCSLESGGSAILKVDDLSDIRNLSEGIEGDVTLVLTVDLDKDDTVKPEIEAHDGDVTVNTITIHVL